jgi:hypothetical protein
VPDFVEEKINGGRNFGGVEVWRCGGVKVWRCEGVKV